MKMFYETELVKLSVYLSQWYKIILFSGKDSITYLININWVSTLSDTVPATWECRGEKEPLPSRN